MDTPIYLQVVSLCTVVLMISTHTLYATGTDDTYSQLTDRVTDLRTQRDINNLTPHQREILRDYMLGKEGTFIPD